MQFCQHKLDNGLEIIAEVNPRAHSTSVGYFVDAGSRDETAEIAGVSHFLEHMAFKGTPRRSAADVNRELDEMGSYSNARTGEERTIYHASVLPEFQNRVVELLADILRPSLREEDFEMEKQVIIEEIHMYEDQPPFGAHEKCMAAFFGDHPLSQSILGSVESVGGLSPQRMREYFLRRYSPGNITLVATGNVDFDGLIAVAEQHCGRWEPFISPREVYPAQPRRLTKAIHKESATQQYTIQMAPGPAADDEDRYAARVLATILGDDTGSRFFWGIVDPGLAEFAGLGAYEFQGAGVFMNWLFCAPDDPADNLRRMRDIETEATRTGVTDAELAQAKSKIASGIILASERPGNRLFAVGIGWLQRREYRTVRESVEQYEAVTRDDIAAILAKYKLTDKTTVSIGPLTDLAVEA